MNAQHDDAFVHHFPGIYVSLRRSTIDQTAGLNDEWSAAEILSAWDELRTLVEPLSAELVVACRSPRSGFIDHEIPPPVRFWLIHASSLPAGVVIDPIWVAPETRIVETLSTPTLLTWIRSARNQTSPAPETHEICWESLRIRAVRACISGVCSSPGKCRLRTDSGILELPIERRDGTLWIAGPIEPISDEPPFSFVLYNMATSLEIKMFVHWSFWTVQGTPGYLSLRQAIRRIIARGWELGDASELFKHDST